jgi:hypothetical protein
VARIAGSVLNVDGVVPTGELGQSSTVDPAFLLAFDEVHGRRIRTAP